MLQRCSKAKIQCPICELNGLLLLAGNTLEDSKAILGNTLIHFLTICLYVMYKVTLSAAS